MASSLKTQLQSLATPASALLVPDRKLKSIIYTPSEAAQFQLDKFYAIGIEGLKELAVISPELFDPYFESPLFDEGSKKLSRAVLTADENHELNQLIENFLITLSPFMLFKSSLKCLEWLQHRFVIGSFNITQILECILPYYDTRAFVNVSQILEIERFPGEAKEWSWLIPFIKSGTTVRRALLYSNANTNFINWLFNTLDKFLNIHSNNQRYLRVYLAFFVSTITGILASFFQASSQLNDKRTGLIKSIVELLLHYSNQFTSFINGTLYESNIDLNCTVYIFLGLIALLIKENPALLEKRKKRLIGLASSIVQTQNPLLQEKAFQLGNLLASIFNIKWEYDEPITAYKLLRRVAPYTNQWDLWHMSSRLIYSHVGRNEAPLAPPKFWKILDSLHLSVAQKSLLLKKVYILYKENLQESERKSFRKGYLEIVERRYPTEFDFIADSKTVGFKDFVKYKDKKNRILFNNKKQRRKQPSVKPIVEAVKCFISFQAGDDLKRLFALIEKFDVTFFGSCDFSEESSEENHAKCIKLCERKNILSLELVLRSFLRIPKGDGNGRAKVFTYALKKSSSVKNRGMCMQFLHRFLKDQFDKEEDMIEFFHSMLLEALIGSKHLTENEREYLIIRLLQFMGSFQAPSDPTEATNESGSQDEQNSPTKSSISSSQGPEVPDTPSKILTRSQAKIIRLENSIVITKSKSPEKKMATELQKIKISSNSKHYDSLLNTLIALCLPSGSERVRKWALNAIESFRGKYETKFEGLIKELGNSRREILSDSEQSNIVVSNALGGSNFRPILKHYIEVIKEESTAEELKIGILRIIEMCSEKKVFGELKEMAKDLLRLDPNSKLLHAILQCYDNDLTSIELLPECLKHQEASKILLQRITRDAFDEYKLEVRKKLFSLMIEASISSKIPQIKVSIQRCVRKWNLESQIVSEELEKCIQLQRTNTSTGMAERRLRDKRAGVGPKVVSKKWLGEAVQWRSITEAVLEFVQNNKRVKNKTRLISPLFTLLKVCINLEEQSPVEYLKQLILSSLSYCCKEDEKSELSSANAKENAEDWQHFNIEIIIDCLRCSRNPQTHHHALILLNYAAKKYPEQVIHGVMSLFTFMGNSILRQDDAYSTQLIAQTVKTIIPTLTLAKDKQSLGKSLVSSGIYRIFISAVQDIPAHRRTPVYYSLIETMGPEESMWQFCLILVDHALTRDKKKSNVNADLDLGTEIIWSFEPQIILKTLEDIYSYISSLPIHEKNSSQNFTRHQMSQNAFSKSIVDLSKKSPRDVQIIIFYALSLVSNVCSKFGDLEDVQVSYDTLLEKCLNYIRLASIMNEEKIFRMIVQRNMEIVEKINSYLSPRELVIVVTSILSGELFSVKKKMLDILNQRILHKAESFGNLDVLLPLLPPLINLVSNETQEINDESITLIQTAFFSLKLIARALAPTYPEEFVPVFEVCFEHASQKNKLLRASALLCIAELFTLKSLIIPRLHDLSNVLIGSFKACSKWVKKLLEESEISSEEFGRTGNLLSLSVITCLTKMGEGLGNFMGVKLLEKSLVSLASLQVQYQTEDEKVENRRKVFESKLKILIKTLATRIPLRNLLAPIKSAYKKILKTSPSSTPLLIGLLQESLVCLPKSEFGSLTPSVCDVFLEEFLSFREFNAEGGLSEDVETVEDVVLDCLVSGLVVKMSETQFRPFYHKIFDWCGENPSRLITFYRLSTAAAKKLKSLFVTFSGHSVGAGAGMLDQDPILTKSILEFYYQIFSNDREGFVSVERFNVLVSPLVDLLDSDFLTSGRVSIKDLSMTLVQLALATNDLNRWQHLINLISYKSRSSDVKVRGFVLTIVEDAASALDKDFLPLLPPAVPFLAELLSDDDEGLEARTQQFILNLEGIVGEPLNSYFT